MTGINLLELVLELIELEDDSRDWQYQSVQYHLAGVVTSIAAHQAGDRLERHLENALASMAKALWVYSHA